VRLTGLDLSITATGVCHTEDSPTMDESPRGCWHLIKTKGTRDDRLVVIRNQVREYVAGSDLVLIEGYLNASKSAGITGMVHGAVRLMLLEEGIPYATIPPSSLKKYATGRGNADKRDMSVAAYKRAALEFTDDNTCDAWWAWVMASDHTKRPVFDLPAVNRESLTKIKMEG
jgi:Holliday junction resolvasome RuvABC endonuclease subunit